eukprot:GHRR01025335.1.p2 GENE.GHRR01025335.1~~GHRR01025335.1.p2  ORF type:complete len:130 (+),score=5.68 GHRR01025335.1:552-941(+)
MVESRSSPWLSTNSSYSLNFRQIRRPARQTTNELYSGIACLTKRDANVCSPTATVRQHLAVCHPMYANMPVCHPITRFDDLPYLTATATCYCMTDVLNNLNTGQALVPSITKYDCGPWLMLPRQPAPFA